MKTTTTTTLNETKIGFTVQTKRKTNSSKPTIAEPRFHVPAQSNPMSFLKPGGAGGMSRLPRGCSNFAKYGMMDSHAGLIALSLGGC